MDGGSAEHGARAYLVKLPTTIERGRFILVRGSLLDPVWDYVLPEYQTAAGLAEMFQAQRTQVCPVGQSHVPLLREEDGLRFSLLNERRVELPDGRRLIINLGSVGQPKDGIRERATCSSMMRPGACSTEGQPIQSRSLKRR